ncbi:MAG: TolC family outer membrane protein [Pseudomonadota bacterium]
MRLSMYALVAMGIGAGVATPVQAESIRSALASAYNHNSELNAQRAATRATDEQLAAAKSGYRPQLSGTGNYGFVRNVTNGVRTDTNPYGYGIQLDQVIFDGFRTLNRVAVAEATIRGSREQLRNTEQTVLQSAATAYVDVLRAQEVLSIRRRNLSFLNEQVRSARARLEVGEGTRTDVAQSQGEQAAARAQVTAAEAQLAGAKAVYRQVIGKAPHNLRWPKGPVRLYPNSLHSAIVLGANQHPAIRLALHSVDAAAFNVKIEQGAFLPTLAFRGSAQKQFNQQRQGIDSSTLSAQVQLTVPIYQGGAASAATRGAKEQLAQTRIQVDVARDQVRAAVVASWSQLQSARASLAASRAQVRAARLALSGLIEERNVGQRTQLDVLLQQSQVLNAQLNVVESRKAQVDAGYALVAAIGRLGGRTLGLHVRHYDPKEHYNKVKDLWFGLRTPSGN